MNALSPRDRIMSDVARIANRHGTTIRDVMGRSRFREHVQARQEVYHYLWSRHSWSLPCIGRLFCRDHTTILSGIASHMIRNGIDHPWIVAYYRRRQLDAARRHAARRAGS